MKLLRYDHSQYDNHQYDNFQYENSQFINSKHNYSRAIMEEQGQVYGLFVFNTPVVLEQVPSKMAKGHKESVTIDWGDYERQGWSSCSSNIKQIKAKGLVLRNNRHQNMLKELQHVSFKSLNLLNLGSNNIYSLQILPKFDAPLLQELILDGNFIISSRSLVKSYFPNIKTININNNPLYDNRRTFQAYFPKLQNYGLDPNQNESLHYGERKWSDPFVWKIKNGPKLANQSQIVVRRRIYFNYYAQNQSIGLTCIKYSEMLSQKPVYYIDIEQ